MTEPVPVPGTPAEAEAPSEAEAPPSPGAAPESASEAEAPSEAESPADLRDELGVLREDLKGTMAGTPGQRIRILILMVVIGIVMLLAFAALRSSGGLGAFAV